jgi:signal transduction histidine kinase
VSVSDNGAGLTPEQREFLWTRFYKGDKNDRKGSGLGMAIAAAVLDAHGAEYGVRCAGGTTIWFVLQSAAGAPKPPNG